MRLKLLLHATLFRLVARLLLLLIWLPAAARLLPLVTLGKRGTLGLVRGLTLTTGLAALATWGLDFDFALSYIPGLRFCRFCLLS